MARSGSRQLPRNSDDGLQCATTDRSESAANRVLDEEALEELMKETDSLLEETSDWSRRLSRGRP